MYQNKRVSIYGNTLTYRDNINYYKVGIAPGNVAQSIEKQLKAIENKTNN